ncbi:MAG: Clp protease N-terminal domain-containing protein [Agathobacter rectalis]
MSKSLHHHYIGTEHILIGLLKEGTGVAAGIK